MRSYRPFRSEVTLDIRQMEVSLRRLRGVCTRGAQVELDIEATIDETARNAGEIEVVTRPPGKPNTYVFLMIDVGGSMFPFSQLMSQLFSVTKKASHFKELRTYYFHNYGAGVASCMPGHLTVGLIPRGGFMNDPDTQPGVVPDGRGGGAVGPPVG